MQMDKRGGAAKKMGCMPAMADGGMVPSKPMKTGKPTGMSTAMSAMGTMPPVRMANGGEVKGKGGPTSDTIPAMLSPGEFVLPADTTKKIGAKALMAIVEATHTPSGKPAVKTGKVAMADGGDPEEARRRAEQAAAQQASPAPTPAPAPAPTGVAAIPSGAPTGSTVPAADGSQGSFLRSTELGRNLNNATNAVAPLGGALASRGISAIDALAGGTSAIGSAVGGSRIAQAVGPVAVPVVAGGALLAASSPDQSGGNSSAASRLAAPPAAATKPVTPTAAAPAVATTPAETQVAPGVFRTAGPGGVPLFFDEASRSSNASLLARGTAPSAQNQRAAEQLANVELQRGAGAQALAQYNGDVARAQAINANTVQLANRELDQARIAKIKDPTERALAVQALQQTTAAQITAPENEKNRAIEAQRVAVQGRVADAEGTRSSAQARLANAEGANAESVTRQLARLDNEIDPKKRARLIEDIQTRQGKAQSTQKFGVTTVGGGTSPVNPADPMSPLQKAPERAFVVNERTGEVQEIGQNTAPAAAKAPDSRAKALLKSNPALAPDYDKKYGPGASREVLGK